MAQHHQEHMDEKYEHSMRECVNGKQCQNDLDELITVIQNYNPIDCNLENEDVTKILDIVLHLISKHDSDHEFERIVNQFGQCNIMECVVFTRHYRNSNKPYLEEQRLYVTQIMDKIHCFYLHSYDIGNRLSVNELEQIYQVRDEGWDECINHTMKKWNELLLNKPDLCQHFVALNTRKKNKFTQLNDLNETNIQTGTDKMYSFGSEYRYDKETAYNKANYIQVRRKWTSLKEELTQNNICRINEAQFKNEYRKAEIHLNTTYCIHVTEFKGIVKE
eukprot:31146_1